MKKYFLLVFIASLSSSLLGQAYKLAKAENIAEILKVSEKDSIQKIERLAAFEFHILLNQYRAKNKKDTIRFNDVFWLTSRNHNLYMIQNDILSHSQKKGSKMFSGERPGDRLDYVQGKDRRYFWTGENCLYNYSANGSNAHDIAKNIAKGSFEQWKNSPGHNQNMLSESHAMHGVAFTIDDYLVYGTDLFGGSSYADNETTTPVKTSSKESKKEEAPPEIVPIEPIPIDIRISPAKTAKELVKELGSMIQEKNSAIISDDLLGKIAQKHVEYLASNKTESATQSKNKSNYYASTVEKRYTKAKYGFWKFLKPTPNNLTQVVAVFEMDEKDFDKEEVISLLFNKLITNESINIEDKKKSGVSIKIRRIKGQLSIYAVIVFES